MLVALGLTLVVAESAMAQSLPVPSVPEVPEVQVPQVQVQVPQVQVPQVPPLPAVPSLPTLPAVPALPALPVVTHQLPVPASQPSTGSQPSRQPSAPSVSRAAPLGSGGRSGPTATARRTRPASSGASAPTGGARPTGRASAGRAAALSPRAKRVARRRERRLRRVVRRLEGCLSGLPALERRVLVLRSGLGPRRPRTRVGVGRRLDLSTGRVLRLERHGLRRLRRAARDGCGGTGEAPAGPDLASPAPATPGFARALEAAATLVGTAPDRIEVKGERQSSGPSSDDDRDALPPELAPAAKPRADRPPPAALVRRGGDGSTDLTLPILLAIGLLGIALAIRSARKALRD